MYPEEVMNANEFTDEICDQLIILTYNYIVTFYKTCGWDSKSIGIIVDEKIKKMLQETIGNIFLKGKTFRMEDNINTKIVSAMTCSAIYEAAYSWFKDGRNDQTDLLLDIVRPYIMNGLEIYGNIDE